MNPILVVYLSVAAFGDVERVALESSARFNQPSIDAQRETASADPEN